MVHWKSVTLLGLCILVMDTALATQDVTECPNIQQENVLAILLHKIDDMHASIGRLDTSESAMKRRIAELETELELNKQANDQLSNKIDDMQVKFNRLERSEKDLKQTIDELLAEHEADRHKHGEVCTVFKNEIDRLGTSENVMKQRLTELENKLDKYGTMDINCDDEKKGVDDVLEEEIREHDKESSIVNIRIQKKHQPRLIPVQSTARVAFTAYLDHTIRNLSFQQTLVYNRVLLNDGNGYSTNTGIFRVPTTGVYLFSWSVTAKRLPHEHYYDVWVRLVVNGQKQLDAVAESRIQDYDSQGGNTAVILCKQGDDVWTVHYSSYPDVFGTSNERSTSFTGVLLYNV